MPILNIIFHYMINDQAIIIGHIKLHNSVLLNYVRTPNVLIDIVRPGHAFYLKHLRQKTVCPAEADKCCSLHFCLLLQAAR